VNFFKKNNLSFPILCLTFLTLFHAVTNFIWLRLDTYPLWFDYGAYFQRSIEIYAASQENLSSLVQAIFGLGEYAWDFNPQRLILPVTSLPFYYFFGLSPDIGVMSCTVFLTISLFSVFGIARRIFDSKVGLLAAFILSVSPGFFVEYRRYSQEFAVAAMVALFGYFVLSSDHFRVRLYSFLGGIAAGLAMITKESALPFLIGISFLPIWRCLKKRRRDAILNLFLLFTVSMLIFLPLYSLHSEGIFNYLLDSAFSDEMRQAYQMPERWSLEGLFYYLKETFEEGMKPFFFSFFLIGLTISLIKRKKETLFLIGWLFISYLILLVPQVRVHYYFISNLIPLAIFSAYGAINIFKNKILRIGLLGLCILFGLMQFLINSFSILKESQPSFLKKWIYYSGHDIHPLQENWKIPEILDAIKIHFNEKGGKRPRVHIGADIGAFNFQPFSYENILKETHFIIQGSEALEDEILASEYIVIRDRIFQKEVDYHENFHERIEVINQKVRRHKGFVRLPKTFPLPDGTIAEIYSKN